MMTVIHHRKCIKGTQHTYTLGYDQARPWLWMGEWPITTEVSIIRKAYRLSSLERDMAEAINRYYAGLPVSA